MLLSTKDLKKLIANQAKQEKKKPEQADSELDNYLASLRLNNEQDEDTDTENGKCLFTTKVCNTLATATNPLLFLDLYRRVNKRKQYTVGNSLTDSQSVNKTNSTMNCFALSNNMEAHTRTKKQKDNSLLSRSSCGN